MSLSEKFDRAMEIFDRVCDLPSPEREAEIAKACGDDDILRGHIDKMLAADDTADAAVDSDSGKQLDSWAARLVDDVSEFEKPPSSIAGYRILRQIGAGGMGVIYEAEQESPRRKVAIKLLRPDAISRDVLRRFQNEAQVLGHLQHPGIAHVYESGVVDVRRAQPFLAMELVSGDRITTHAGNRNLSINQRVELVARMCDAVQHAHQKGIIHRDLKPANVLVIDQEGETATKKSKDKTISDVIGQPKILDFGIARITDQDVHAATMHTEVGQIIGTLAYMSPEQLTGDPAGVDTRTDVYSIGVILYQLLTDRLPIEIQGKSLAEAAQLLHDRDPASIANFNRSLRGDLDTIVTKALAKEPDRRYASASALADDLRRFLHSEPIAAHPPSAVYQVRKFAKRNRGLVTGAVAAVLALVVGLTITSILLVRVSEERTAKQHALEKSEKERIAKTLALETSEEVTRFFTDMITNAQPQEQGKDVTVREMVDRAATTIDQRLSARPMIETRIRRTMADTYVSLSEFKSAQQQIDEAEAILNSLPEPDLTDRLGIQVSRAEVYFYLQQYPKAIVEFDKAIELAKLHPTLELQVAEIKLLRALGLVRMEKFDLAEQEFQSVLRLLDPESDGDIDAFLSAQSGLAELYSRRNSPKAEPLYKVALETSIERRGDAHPETILINGNLAAHYMRVDRVDEAIEILERVLAVQRESLGPAHRQTLISANNLGLTLSRVGQADKARKIVEDALSASDDEHGSSSPTSLFLTNTLVDVLYSYPKASDELEELLVRSVTLHKDAQGPLSQGTFDAQKSLLAFLVRKNRFDEALTLGRELVDFYTGTLPENHHWFVEARYYIAMAYFKSNRLEAAEQELVAIEPHANDAWRPTIIRRIDELKDVRQ